MVGVTNWWDKMCDNFWHFNSIFLFGIFRQELTVKRNTKMLNTSYLRWESSSRYRWADYSCWIIRLSRSFSVIKSCAADHAEVCFICRTTTWTVSVTLLWRERLGRTSRTINAAGWWWKLWKSWHLSREPFWRWDFSKQTFGFLSMYLFIFSLKVLSHDNIFDNFKNFVWHTENGI